MSKKTEEENTNNQTLESGTYDIIRKRLLKQGDAFKQKLEQLNHKRLEVFGVVETKLITTERITTENNCLPRDIIALGNNLFLFGYNVHIGLRSKTVLKDVFSIYTFDPKSLEFSEQENDIFTAETFLSDFENLYKYYRETKFVKFYKIGPYFYMVFRIGKSESDIKVFKWLVNGSDYEYVGNRFEHEFKFPKQHQFEWTTISRDSHIAGAHPHISIEDKVFVETIGGDLTIKIENNTETGQGIYAEKVDNPDQTLDDADIKYAIVDNLILLKIKPYQEQVYRYLVYNQKIQEVVKIDAIKDACILLPNNQGIIFPKGYYINTGEFKLFDTQYEDMLFEKRIASANGEDFLYVFYNKSSGVYILLSYNIISQKVETPIVCNGYTLFEDGKLALFKTQEETQKHHPIQIWQTTYFTEDKHQKVKSDSYLTKIGNKDVVKALSEGQELLKLINKEDSFTNLYADIVKKSVDLIDTYHWIKNKEAFGIDKEILSIKKTAHDAIDEFDKVISLKKHAKEKLSEIEKKVSSLLSKSKNIRVAKINDFVLLISDLRHLKGELIAAKEIRFIDEIRIKNLEESTNEAFDFATNNCVNFLLKREALEPYENSLKNIFSELDKLKKVVQANDLEKEIDKLSKELELLIEIVSNLKILDPTKTTEIIEKITNIFSKFNSAKTSLRTKRKALQLVEGKAEFSAQIRLVEQGFINYLDVSDTPDKCDEYLNKLSVQLEDLEGKFADFDEYIEIITDKREDIYNAFESKKVALVEQNNKRVESIHKSALRIINGLKNKAKTLKSIVDVNAFFASDLLVEKVNNSIQKLIDYNDVNKADDIQSKLNSIKEEVLRQLKDKLELFENDKTIAFGNHKFLVNSLNLDATVVNKDGDLYFHITGTNFYEKIANDEIKKYEHLWDRYLSTENNEIYRAEYLAYLFFTNELKDYIEWSKKATSDKKENLHHFMSTQLNGGYIKGVHDEDALKIIDELVSKKGLIKKLEYAPYDRVNAILFWEYILPEKDKESYLQAIKNIGDLYKVFNTKTIPNFLINDLLLRFNNAEIGVENVNQLQSVKYLIDELTESNTFVITKFANDLINSFNDYLKNSKKEKLFNQLVLNNSLDWKQKFAQIKFWIITYVQINSIEATDESILEVALYYLLNDPKKFYHLNVDLNIEISGLQGDHRLIKDGVYKVNYNAFKQKLNHFTTVEAVDFTNFHHLKSQLIHQFKEDIRISEYLPKVLNSFVRNQLIDKVYLPLVGANFAKQMGSVGINKRTDLMGLLLLISPPGYGKTTLMEYIANRLGLVFMKINGPAIGHEVTSLDDESANNATAREELKKLNLALEMGDNVMIYLDDIQHCNPEFLQKFISLCDAQRKIEGVYKGKTKTYDFKGKKVAVVMAGNPYTESGEKFQIPDMLANRADVYNLGDILGDTAHEFKLSYIENSLTSNPIFKSIKDKSKKDIYNLIKVANGTPLQEVELEFNFNSQELDDIIELLKKSIYVRDILLKVNDEYMASAGIDDAYRTEPPFKLQGSYRDMNKIVEKLNPLLNQQELDTIILSHYENESQTLTNGAESNLLKFKLMNSFANDIEKQRWADIIEEFERQQKLKGYANNEMASVVEQMSNINQSIHQLSDANPNEELTKYLQMLAQSLSKISNNFNN